MTWLDLVTMAIMGAIGLGVYEVSLSTPSHKFLSSSIPGQVC